MKTKKLIPVLDFWIKEQKMRGKGGFKRLTIFILPNIQSLSKKEFEEVVKGIEGVWSASEIKGLQKLYDNYRK